MYDFDEKMFSFLKIPHAIVYHSPVYARDKRF